MRLTDKEKETISFLALNGLKTRYDLFKKGGIMSSSTAHKVIKHLTRVRIITVKKEEAFRGRERVKKLYGLTFTGLLVALILPENLSQIGRIARKHEDLLPFLFGKWQHYRDCGIEETELIKLVKLLVNTALQGGAVRAEMLLQDFFRCILAMTTPEEKVKWLKAIHDDQELRQEALIQERSFRIYMKLMETAFDLVKQPEPDWTKACTVFKSINRMPIAPENYRANLEASF